MIGVGSSTLLASTLGGFTSSKRSRGSRAAYNIFATIGLGLSISYFIWAIDLGFFAWIALTLMMAMITGLSNSAIIERKLKKYEHRDIRIPVTTADISIA